MKPPFPKVILATLVIGLALRVTYQLSLQESNPVKQKADAPTNNTQEPVKIGTTADSVLKQNTPTSSNKIDQTNQPQTQEGDSTLPPLPVNIYPTDIYPQSDEPLRESIDPFEDQEIPLLGGWNSFDTNNLSKPGKQIDQLIRSRFTQLKDPKQVKLVSAKTQVVFGWNYQFKYQKNTTKKSGDDKNSNQVTVSERWELYAYQDPDNQTNQSSIQTYEKTTLQVDSNGNTLSVKTFISRGDNLKQEDIPSEKDLANEKKELEKQMSELNENLNEQMREMNEQMNNQNAQMKQFMDELFQYAPIKRKWADGKRRQ